MRDNGIPFERGDLVELLRSWSRLMDFIGVVQVVYFDLRIKGSVDYLGESGCTSIPRH